MILNLFLLTIGYLQAETRHLLVTQIGPSVRCSHDLTTFWDKKMNRCRPCKEFGSLIPGYEYSPNCGRDDHSGTQDVYQVPCPRGTYNDGKNTKCLKCTDCPPEKPTAAECSGTVDSQCCGIGEEVISGKCFPKTTSTQVPTMLSTTETQGNTTTITTLNPAPRRTGGGTATVWTVVVCACLLTGAVALYVLKRRRATGCECTGVRKKPSIVHLSVKDSLLHAETNSRELFGFNSSEEKPTSSDVMQQLHSGDELNGLAPSVEKAPVSVVLDDLDVLEELVMLLDPDRPGAKSTRHVAARCGFSATWVNYAYSMRESRSPLKAVLEGVTAKFPEWTVGDLARVLGETGRNDAVAVLSKLPPPPRSGAAENRPPVAGSPPPERTPLTCHYGR